MRLNPRHFLLGLCLTLVGASPAREQSSSGEGASRAWAGRAMGALAVEQGGRLSLEAAGRRFEFGQGRMAVSAGDSSWIYRFQGAKGGIRALSLSTLPEQTAAGSLEYRHGEGIIERYLVKSRGVEQQFVLRGPYAGGDVLLTGSVETDLVPEATSSFEGIAFRRDDVTAHYYGEAKAIDAAGRTALLEERWSAGELTIVVPASFLAGAKFPVLVDPFIGTRVTVDPAVDLAQNPAVATTGGSATFRALAVWSTNLTSPRFIRGRIIDAHGNTIVGPISAVDEGSGVNISYTNPRVAWSGVYWVVAAVGHDPLAGVNPNFIQVNRIDTAGTKTTGASLKAVLGDQKENDVDVACNNSGLCLITWLVDSDNGGTLDSVKGVFYTPSTDTFGSIFSVECCGFTHSQSRVASNGTDFYVVFGITTAVNFIEGYSVTSGGVVMHVEPSQTFFNNTNPEVSYNSHLNRYLVAWGNSGSNVRGSTLTGATPPVVSTPDTQLAINASRPELTSQQYMGWSMAIVEPGGPQAAIILIRPNLTSASSVVLDAAGAVTGADVAHFYRGLSIAVYADDRGSATDHDIRAREFIVPAMEYADVDNNGYASGFVWRPGANASFYYNDDLISVTANSVQFGTTGDIPARMDSNGDAVSDLAVFRPSTGYWYIDTDRNGTVNASIQFGAGGDIPVPGDYDGDGRTDIAVFRPSTGYWYIRYAATGTTVSAQFGASGDIPVPADYNGDYLTDIAVWRPSTGTWYVDTNLNGTVNIQAQFGTSGDIPVPGDYGPSGVSNAPDGRADFAVFRPSAGTWYVSRNRNGVVDLAVQFGTNGDVPVGGIYDSNPDVNSPFAVFRPSNGTWYVDTDNNGTVNVSKQFGAAGDIPMQQPSGQYRN